MIVSEDLIKSVVERPVASYEKAYKCVVLIDLFCMTECFQKAFESTKRDFASKQAPNGYNLSPYKIAGILCFWIRKLKPFKVEDIDSLNRFVNETLGFLIGFYLVFGYCRKKPQACSHTPRITDRFFHDLIKSFRYNSHSPNSTAFIFESLSL